MWMDAISEKIAHFIGAFELIEQEARMRAEYDKFRAIKNAEDDARAIELRSLKAKEAYQLEDVDAGVKVKAPPPEAVASAPEQIAPTVQNPITLASAVPIPVLEVSEEIGSLGVATHNATLNFKLPPPSSIAQVTYQVNTLSDNDSFGAVISGGFQAVSSLIATLHSVSASVAPLLPMKLDVLPTSDNWSVVIGQIQTAAAAIGTGTNGTLTTTVLLGDSAKGTFIDGVAAEEFVAFKDMQPAYIAEKLAKAEAAAAPHDATTDGHDFGADFGKAESPFKVEDGHAVVAGANSLVNTASITSSWLDAKVIAVAGDVVRMDAISQVNVIVDHDSVTNGLSSSLVADQSSMASNAAKIGMQTVAAAKLAAQEAAAKAAAEDGNEYEPEPATNAEPSFLLHAPANWAVVRYDGPVTQINWVKQHSFATDYDQAVVTFSGSATFLGLGENNLSNSFNIHELGYHYDLILVGGNLIDINLISQLNILLDSDVIDTTSSARTQPSENLETVASTLNGTAATGVESDIAEVTAQPVVAASIAIDGTNVDGTSQQSAATNGVAVEPPPVAGVAEHTGLETDAADPALDAADAQPNGSPPATASAFSTGDNLAYNQASIQTIGQDTDAAINQTFADVLNSFAQGNDYIPDEVVEDPAFLGTELLRVLYIDGDFTTVNMVEQVNILGDADQVHLARDNFASDLQDMIKVTTGSNILANIAAIRDNGMDSTVMAQGTAYSDALIYQANLIDTDLMETGTSIADLANEAVAFLTDDMGADTLGDDITNSTHGLIADAMGQSDIMQTMLS